jgi:hypothetical protein
VRDFPCRVGFGVVFALFKPPNPPRQIRDPDKEAMLDAKMKLMKKKNEEASARAKLVKEEAAAAKKAEVNCEEGSGQRMEGRFTHVLSFAS